MFRQRQAGSSLKPILPTVESGLSLVAGALEFLEGFSGVGRVALLLLLAGVFEDVEEFAESDSLAFGVFVPG